ncbi:MAG: PocR ligand-binding domain-containing protein [Anaerolinea sp.]|nr:PocR ligand-binding domain-containing protein [Anaerolinea sp.]
MADKLLTTREIQDLLHLDRVTIYRMVKDGELPALRVGGQWRFSSEAIHAWLQGQREGVTPQPRLRPAGPGLDTLRLDDLIDLSVLQTIQNQFAELAGVAAFITDLEGEPFVTCSRCSAFCQIIHSRAEGMAACQATWRSIAQEESEGAAIHVCHAGNQYASAPISVGGRRLGLVIAGQFLTAAPDPAAFAARAQATGERVGVSGEALAEARDSLNIVSPEQALQIAAILQTIANALSSIGYQSYQARQTLARIAELTAEVGER